MLNEFKGDLIDAVKAAVEVLTDEEALAIIAICREATEREAADASERCLAELIEGRRFLE